MSSSVPEANRNISAGGIFGPHITSLKFAKLHSPKMKSVYWRHFGFPTNENDCIITKQNVVCILCHKVLTNHGNTTNLRAHLQYRHKDIFKKIIAEHGIKVPPRKVQSKSSITSNNDSNNIEQNVMETKIKMEYSDSLQDINSMSGICDEQSILYESVIPMTYDDDEIIDSNHFTKIEVLGSGINSRNDSVGDASEYDDRVLKSISINSNEMVDPYQLQEILVNLVVQDMRNVECLYEPGMALLLRTLNVPADLPSIERVESCIREMHSDKHTSLVHQLKIHSQFKPYSMGFELWSNIEQKRLLSIYFNYVSDSPEYNLHNRLFCTIEYNKYISIHNLLEDIDLLNCTAAIINTDYDCDNIRQFLLSKNIPLIIAYDAVIDRCLRNVFEMPTVAAIIEEIKDVITRFSLEIRSKDVEVPVINAEFPWTYYELLKFFSECVSWPEEIELLVTSVKVITDIINSLAVTVDTLRGEEILLSSMLSPITTKVLNKKLTVNSTDDQFVTSIKSIIFATLEEFVLSNDRLTISALLDPRFHRLTKVNNINNCLFLLSQDFNRISIIHSADESSLTSAVGQEINSNIKLNTQVKKSNLELFFDLTDTTAQQPGREADNIEADLARYRNEVYASLDESPFIWWQKMGNLYTTLKKIVPMYQCVPCTVNTHFRKPLREQISEYQKRFILTGNLIDAIFFLHYNK